MGAGESARRRAAARFAQSPDRRTARPGRENGHAEPAEIFARPRTWTMPLPLPDQFRCLGAPPYFHARLSTLRIIPPARSWTIGAAHADRAIEQRVGKASPAAQARSLDDQPNIFSRASANCLTAGRRTSCCDWRTMRRRSCASCGQRGDLVPSWIKHELRSGEISRPTWSARARGPPGVHAMGARSGPHGPLLNAIPFAN